MPIAVQCPNPACAKSFRVQDAAAGRAGKCPVCGTEAPTIAPEPPAAALASAVGVIRFEAIGEAWGLFRQRAGLWMLAALLTVVFGNAVQFGLFFLSIPLSILGGVFLGGALSRLMGMASLAAGLAVWGLFLGGMFRMALR